METDTRHTPTPWEYIPWGQVIEIRQKPAEGSEGGIAMLNANGNSNAGIPSRRDRANAELIVQAVNNHEALVEALRGILENCALIHNRWGEGCNQKEADAAVKSARALLSQLEAK